MADESDVETQGLYQNALQYLLGSHYGAKIVDADTKERVDTGVHTAMEEIANFLATGQIVLRRPLQIVLQTNGEPGIQIVYANQTTGQFGQQGEQGDSDSPNPTTPVSPGIAEPMGPTAAIQILNEYTGETAQLGIGLQNQGLVANEFVPWPVYFVNPETTQEEFTNTGGGQGPTGVTGYNPPVYGGTGSTGRRTGVQYGQVVGTGGGWSALPTQTTPGVPPSTPGQGPNFPYNTGPLGFGLWWQYYGQNSPPGFNGVGNAVTSGHTGTETIVTDVTWDEEACTVTVTTKDFEFEDGLLKSVT